MADELELLEQLSETVTKGQAKTKKDLEEIRTIAEKAMAGKEIEDKIIAGKAWMDDLNAQVELINTDIAKKGATINQLLEEITEFKTKRGRILMPDGSEAINTKSLISDAIGENFEKIKAQGNRPKAYLEFDVKTVGNMTAAGNLTGAVQATYANQPALRGRQKLQFRDLVNVIPSATGLWKFYRQDAVPGEGSFDFQTTHGAVKNQVDYDMTEVTVTVDYLAGFVRIAKQMLQDLPFMQSFVSNELVEDYLRSETSKFFGQLYTAATGSASASSSTVTAEKIIDYIAALEENDYSANGAVVTNLVWAKLLKTKPSDYSLPGGNAVTVTGNGDVMIAGVPILRTKASNIGNNMMLIGDWTKAAIIQTEGLNVNMYEQDSDNVQRNLVTIKAEARVALAVLRTNAFIYASAGTT